MRLQVNIFSQYPVIHEQKVAWGDMDAFGHVNNVIYYRYIESARIGYFDELNIFDYDVFSVRARKFINQQTSIQGELGFGDDTNTVGLRGTYRF